MLADHPEIAQARDWLAGRNRHVVGCVLAVIVGGLGLITERRHQRVELTFGEAGERKVEAVAVKRMQFGREQFLVPACVERELVVGDHVGSTLCGRQVIENDDRNRIEPELARRQQPAVAGNNTAPRVNQDRVGPTELDDRGRNLRDLSVVMRSGVTRVRAQPVERPMLDRVGQSRGHAVWFGGPGATGGNWLGRLPRGGYQGGGVSNARRCAPLGHTRANVGW